MDSKPEQVKIAKTKPWGILSSPSYIVKFHGRWKHNKNPKWVEVINKEDGTTTRYTIGSGFHDPKVLGMQEDPASKD